MRLGSKTFTNMGKSMDNADGCMKFGCVFDIIGGLFIFYGFIIQFGDSSTFGERFGYMMSGLILICIGLAINSLGGIWFAGAAASNLVVYTINKVVDAFSVKEEVKKRCPNALKIQILEKKQNAVNVGIFNNATTMSQKVSIQSNQGVSDSIHVGQVIYMNN